MVTERARLLASLSEYQTFTRAEILALADQEVSLEVERAELRQRLSAWRPLT
jgi:hypothetical protein